MLCLLYEVLYGHTEEWGSFVDVKDWGEIKNPEKFRYGMKRPFDAPPIVVNYFFHEEVKKSAKKKNQ